MADTEGSVIYPKMLFHSTHRAEAMAYKIAQDEVEEADLLERGYLLAPPKDPLAVPNTPALLRTIDQLEAANLQLRKQLALARASSGPPEDSGDDRSGEASNDEASSPGILRRRGRPRQDG